MKTTIKAKLLAVQKDLYSNYVFQNLYEPENSKYRYLTVTMCPNWQFVGTLEIGDVGYLEYDFVEAGESYINKTTNETEYYKNTANYFMNFVKDVERDNKKEFNF